MDCSSSLIDCISSFEDLSSSLEIPNSSLEALRLSSFICSSRFSSKIARQRSLISHRRLHRHHMAMSFSIWLRFHVIRFLNNDQKQILPISFVRSCITGRNARLTVVKSPLVLTRSPEREYRLFTYHCYVQGCGQFLLQSLASRFHDIIQASHHPKLFLGTCQYDHEYRGYRHVR